MASSKKAIKDFLESLSKKDFKKFRQALVDRKAKPRVATSRVEGEDFLVVTNVIFTTYGEAEALEVVLELLRTCNIDAAELVEETKELTSKAGSSQSAGASAGTDHVTPKADGEHFVDKYRVDLTQRVNSISEILDQLLTKKVIDQETYDKIRVLRPSQEQVRALYRSLNAAPACKDIFYDILVEKEKWLIDDLKKKE